MITLRLRLVVTIQVCIILRLRFAVTIMTNWAGNNVTMSHKIFTPPLSFYSLRHFHDSWLIMDVLWYLEGGKKMVKFRPPLYPDQDTTGDVLVSNKSILYRFHYVLITVLIFKSSKLPNISLISPKNCCNLLNKSPKVKILI